MLSKKNKYIHLENNSKDIPTIPESIIIPDMRTVHLAGKRWGWIWNRPKGVLIQEGDRIERVPILDFTRILQVILYGASLIMALVGVGKMISSNTGE